MAPLSLLLALFAAFPLGYAAAGAGARSSNRGPEPVGPETLSAGEVYRGSFGPDGNTLCFFKKVGEDESYRIFSSARTPDGWSAPARVDLGGEFSDLYPSISRDGRRMVFSSYRPVPGAAGGRPNAQFAEALASAEDGPELRYVANAGMLVTVGGRRFLIDAPIRDGIAPYATSPARERDRLEAARPPYDGVDAVLITHWHEDHFSPDAVAAHLAHNPRAVVVSSPEVVERLRAAAPDLPAARLRAVLPSPGRSEEVRVGDVPVRVLRIRHNPSRRLPEQHVGFLIGDSTPVLHVGDADPAADNFALLRALPRVDLALLPFWYVLDPTNRRFVADVIGPRQVVGMHLPPGDAGRVAAALREANVPVVLPPEPGSLVALGR